MRVLRSRLNAARNHYLYPKSARNGTSNSALNSGRATDRSPTKMRNISIETRARSGLPMHTAAEKPCTRDLVTPKKASRDLFEVIRCS